MGKYMRDMLASMQQGNKVGRGNNVENGGVGPKRFIREETPTCPF